MDDSHAECGIMRLGSMTSLSFSTNYIMALAIVGTRIGMLSVLNTILRLATLIPLFAVGGRRLNDVNRFG